jgi:hypothetical protein
MTRTPPLQCNLYCGYSWMHRICRIVQEMDGSWCACCVQGSCCFAFAADEDACRKLAVDAGWEVIP